MRVLTVALLLLAVPTVSRAASFDLRFDRVVIDGNAFGPADGVPDLADDFDDGVLAPDWQEYTGTVSEGGGLLHTTNPGAVLEINGSPYELSNARSALPVADGLGNFTVDATLAAGIPAADQTLSLSVWNEATAEVFSAALTNVVAVGGLSFVQSIGQSTGNDLQTVDQFLSLDPDSVSGPIVVRLMYDDTANTMQAAFSVDGGVSFAVPFATAPLPTPLDHLILLSGFVPGALPTTSTTTSSSVVSTTTSSTTTTLPPPFSCTGPMLTNLRASVYFNQVNSVSFRARIPLSLAGYDAVTEGAEVAFIVIRGPGYLEVESFYGSNAVPPGGLGTGCGPDDGWRATARGFKYRNKSGARPPDCAPFSMPLQVLRFSRERGDTIMVRGRVRPATRQGNHILQGTGSLAVVLGQGPEPIAAGRCGTGSVECTPTPSVFRCPFP